MEDERFNKELQENLNFDSTYGTEENGNNPLVNPEGKEKGPEWEQAMPWNIL